MDRGSAADTRDVSQPEAVLLAIEPELVVVDLDVAKDGRADCCVSLGKETAWDLRMPAADRRVLSHLDRRVLKEKGMVTVNVAPPPLAFFRLFGKSAWGGL